MPVPFLPEWGFGIEAGEPGGNRRGRTVCFFEKKEGNFVGRMHYRRGPTLEKELGELAGKIKEMGYLVKLDTNGLRPEVVGELLEDGLLDYIAMDVKNSMERYGETVGLEKIDVGKIRETIDLMMASGIDYEFRTTVVKELHGKKDMEAIGEEIRGAKAYFLQSYQESQGVIAPVFHSYSREEMEELAEAVRPFVPGAQVRG